jgi:ParB family chromosome partitioning protein
VPKNNFDDLFKKVPKQTPGAFSGIATVVDTVVKKTKRRYGTIPLDRVRPNPFQPRKQFDQQKLAELGDSIKEHGLLEPLVVRESTSENGSFELACGERRWRAMQLKNIAEAEAIILDKDCTNEELEQIALIENVQREDLSPMELALAYDRLRKNTTNSSLRSISEVAAIVHQSKSTVDDHLSILRAPEDVRQLVIDNPDIPLRVIRDLSNVEKPEDRAYLIDEVRSGSLTSNAITRILQQLKRAQREEVTVATVTAPILEQNRAPSSPAKSPAGAINEELPPSPRTDQVVEAIEEAPRPRRAASPVVTLAALEQKLIRDSKQIQKITQRLTEDIMHMTPEEKRCVRDSVDQWHIWTRQILDLVSE